MPIQHSTMPSILIIDKNSVIKPYNTKTFVEDELYKKAGFKSKEGFAKHAEWNVTIKNTTSTVVLYGKTTGRAGQENKYDFPPPADNTLFFGSCVLVCTSGENVVDISHADWEKIYEQLFGGFEDINADDSADEEDDTEEDENVPRTKEGYVKDGFIVDDDETEESEDNDYEPIVSAKSKSKSKPKTTQKKVVSKPPKKNKSTEKPFSQECTENIQIKIYPEINVPLPPTNTTEDEFDPTYLSCTDELVEESYL